MSSGSKGKNVSGDQKSPTKVVGVGHSSPTKKPFKKFFPKSKKLLEKQPPPNNNSKEEVTSTATSKDANKMQEDVAVQPTGTFTIYVWNTYYLLSTVWKFNIIPAIQILCEIRFERNFFTSGTVYVLFVF